MKRAFSAGVALALSSTLIQPLAAEDRDRIYINPAVGYQYFEDDRDLKLNEAVTYSLGLEYRFHDHWAVEGLYGKAEPDLKNRSGDVDYEDFRLDGLYYFDDLNTSRMIQPYLATGGGRTEFAGNDETRLNAGGGLRLLANERVSLRLDAREFYSLDEEAWDTVVSLGLSFAFSRQAEAAPPPAPAPTPTPATPPADSDNDGVSDNTDRCPNTPAGAAVTSDGCPRDSDRDGVADYRDACPGTKAGVKVDENGCEGVTERVETISLYVPFPLNSSQIPDTYDSEIREVADFMKEYPDTTVEVAGHSDSTGEADYNRQLSQKRAEAVAERLAQSFGINRNRVKARGYGESEPIADNSTAEGRAQNRRVEARIEKVIR